jgi:signal transduction histidine kinase
MAVGIIGGVVAPRMEGFGRVPTPFPIRIAAAEMIISIGMVAYLAAAAASVASVVLRYRRSRGEERAQLKWIAAAGGFAVMALAIGIAAQFAGLGVQVVAILMILGFLSIPVAAGIAVLKYRLYEIDVVINRAVVYGLLATFVTGLYIAIVVGIGAAVGRRGGLLLPGVAAAVVALIFHPARLRAQRFANRLVYGKRATPYEVLSRFSDRLAGAYSVDDALPRMARLVAEGTGAARTAVWLAVGEQLRTAATWPSSERPEARALDGEDLPEFPNWDRAFSVRHQGELLGAITITKPPGVPLTPTEEKLLSDVASQAALVLRNVRLIEDLRASRQRLVAAQDEERRRLERNIHDGAQQQLVALAVKLRLAESLVDKDPGRARDLIAEVKAEAGEALDTLRELARGIYPPLLADQGLAAALRAQARKAPVPVTVTAEGIPRLPAEVEASIYFCCLEALQNVAKYAEAREVLIAIAAEDGAVAFRITDDGRGFDPATTRPGLGLQNMRDRVEALGGTFAVTSRSGEGTTIAGRIPLQAAPVAADQAAVSRSGSNSDLGM